MKCGGPVIIVFLLFSLIFLSGCIFQSKTPSNTVEIKNGSFQPSSITVTMGTTVIWKNLGGANETITSPDASFSSSIIPVGYEFRFTFLQPGVYKYYSKNDRSIYGVVVVTAPDGSLSNAQGNTPGMNASRPTSSVKNGTSIASEMPVSVEIKDFAFHPNSTTVPAGTPVIWKNDDSVSHTVTSMNGEFGSDVLRQGQEFSHTFVNPGTYDYRCAIHPYMQAQVIVTTSGGAPPSHARANGTGAILSQATSTEINFEGKTILPVSTTSPQPSTRVTVDLLAKEMNFDRDNITVIAGAKVNINFVNLDRGVPHNFAVYANSAADTVIFQGQVVIGPGSITYTFNAPADPGIYFFRCDVHPKVMYGQFIVLPSEGVGPSALQVAPAVSQTSMEMPASAASAGSVTGKSAMMANTTSPNTTELNTTAINEFGVGQESITVDLVAENIAFDKNVITVPSGAHVTVNFVNRDSGVPHTFSVYETAATQKVIFRGQAVTGLAKIKYNFDAPADPGTYFFRCDIHPTQMTGQFVVVASGNETKQASKTP
jgi:plastocyanin